MENTKAIKRIEKYKKAVNKVKSIISEPTLIEAIDTILLDYEKLQKENEELSYIISEIEQYALDEQINEESIDYNEFIEVQNMAFDRVYNKLQELLNKGE